MTEEHAHVCTCTQGRSQKDNVSIKILSTIGGGGTKSSSLRQKMRCRPWVHKVRSSGSLPSRRDRQLAGCGSPATVAMCSFRQLAIRFCSSSTRRGSWSPCRSAAGKAELAHQLTPLSLTNSPNPLASPTGTHFSDWSIFETSEWLAKVQTNSIKP